jgi:hypothetical protein
MANTLRIKRRLTGASGAPTGLALGELAHSFVDDKLWIGNGSTSVVIGGEGHFAPKTYVDSAVAAEASLRSASDDTLTTNLASEVTRAQGAEGVLDGKITTEKGRIDAILSASQADKDSFAEIVTLINSVDTENDQAFAGYVTSNNAALSAEISSRQSGDSTLTTNLAAEVTARQNAISAEQSARSSAISTVTGLVSDEVSRAQGAEAALSGRVTSLETTAAGLGTMSTQNANNVAITGGTIDGINFDGGSF